MLVLSRKRGEVIDFPSLGISIEVSKIKGNVVVLGVAAPSDIKILRGELQERRDGESDRGGKPRGI